ncbi:MAG: phage baseplate assembly protein V [Spirochaetales bacterium]|nr:phage baseplate assembly protein V [Spirochaetales bacterium]
MFDFRDRNRIFRENYHPGNALSKRRWQERMWGCTTTIGIVSDNRDPDGLGRVKVSLPYLMKNGTTHWIQMARMYSSAQTGTWYLPEIGDQVVIAFHGNDTSFPVVIGGVYTPRHAPPVAENPENNLKVITTKSGLRVEMNDTAGEERIVLSAKEGQLRIVVTPEGVSIANEIGDVTITCNRFQTESAALRVAAEGATAIEAGEVTVTASAAALTSSGNITVSGSQIELAGSGGVTSGMKQLAAENDQVVGVDMHDIDVPSSSGLTTVPMIPHPYLGKLTDGLSSDVTVNGKPAATLDSVSTHNPPGHIPMPPGVKFTSTPSGEGTVSSGTAPTVLINGKEAALLGSMVSTCNDPQDQETCTIIAVGASVVLPIMMPGMDPDQFEQDGGTHFNTSGSPATMEAVEAAMQPRSLSSPQWGSSPVTAGEEVTLSVTTSGLRTPYPVRYTIYEAGADPATDPPVKTVFGQNEGSRAEARWRPTEPRRDSEETEREYYFIAKAFRCEKVESPNVTVERAIPTFTELQWHRMNEDGSEEAVNRVSLEEQIVLTAQVEHLEVGENAKLRIYDRPSDSGPDVELERALVEVTDDGIRFVWRVQENQNAPLPDDPVYPTYVFTLESVDYGDAPTESPTLEVAIILTFTLRDWRREPVSGKPYRLVAASGTVVREGETDEHGQALETDLGRADYHVEFGEQNEEQSNG